MRLMGMATGLCMGLSYIQMVGIVLHGPKMAMVDLGAPP